MAHHHPLIAGIVLLRFQNGSGKALGLAGIIHRRLVGLIAGQAGDDRHGRLVLAQNGHAIGGQRQMPVAEGNHPHRVDLHQFAGRRFPQHIARQHTRAHIEPAFEGDQFGGRQKEGLVIHVQLNDLAVGKIEHGLAGFGEAEGRFPIGDGP